VAGGVSFVEISSGSDYTCARAQSGAGYCWGSNLSGQLGDGTTTSRFVPTPIAGGIGFVEITAGYLHTCGRTQSGAVYCWGSNGCGQLGDGTGTDRLVPTLVHAP
jgi:alpha-tubulin suppressor-like RCC1 family protein